MEALTSCKPTLEVADDLVSLALRSLKIFVAAAEKAINTRGIFYVAISGGHTPKRFFELLGQRPESRNLPWSKIQLFWVDERYVPPDSASSNYKLAADTFLHKVAIPQKNIHRVSTECSDSQEAARCYEQTIRKVFRLKENDVPEFDLIMLGIGPDGHIGSLFPNSYAPFDKENLVCVVYALDREYTRITLTQQVLLAASQLLVLVSGDEKAGILKEVLTSEPDEVRYPVHILWPVLDKVTWLVDRKAAKFL
jgi:6-phosphogluconolactonase